MLVPDLTALACSFQGFVGMCQKQKESKCCTCSKWQGKTNLKHSNGIGVRQAVQDHRSLHAIEIHPLNPVHVGLSPVDPVVIHRNAVGPPHALRDDAAGQRPVHVTSVDASPGVPPVCPEHQPGSRQRGYSKSTRSSSTKGTSLGEAELGMLYISLHYTPLNRELCNSNEHHQQIYEQLRGF